jgi:hypothetical protein
MKMIGKKMITMLLVAAMMVGALYTPALANTANSAEQPLDGFYVISGEVPQEAIAHVQGSIGGIIKDLFHLDTVTVGTPFKLSGTYYDLYNFIIFSNDEIVGVYRVYKTDDGYTGIFSENTEIIRGLQELKGLTSPDNPARITAGSYDDIYAVIGSDVHTILGDPAGNVTDEQSFLIQQRTFNTESVVNVSKGIGFTNSNVSISTTPTYKFLQIGWAETQSSLPWCMAYVTASIMRYKTGESLSTMSARTVMEWAYPDLSTTELEAASLSTSKADGYANTYDVDPTYTAYRRTYAQVASEIIADNPVAFICDNVNTGTKQSHAFVCRGYNDNAGSSFYSIWNPWYTEFERIYTSDNTYVNSAGTAKYLWSATMYGWN